MTGAAERLAKIGEAVARLNVVGQEEGWSGHVHVAVYATDLGFVLACLRDAEAALERVREQHPRVDLDRPVEGVTAVCDYDGVPWPCPTVAALSGLADDGGEG